MCSRAPSGGQPCHVQGGHQDVVAVQHPHLGTRCTSIPFTTQSRATVTSTRYSTLPLCEAPPRPPPARTGMAPPPCHRALGPWRSAIRGSCTGGRYLRWVCNMLRQSTCTLPLQLRHHTIRASASACHHANNKIVARFILFSVLRFWVKSTEICAGAMPYRRDGTATTRI